MHLWQERLQQSEGDSRDLWLRGRRRCARHGHWIGGGSPLRGELVATVSRRQLHAAWSVVRRATLAPRGRVGKKPEANRSTERK
jgi:hypothetical protein